VSLVAPTNLDYIAIRCAAAQKTVPLRWVIEHGAKFNIEEVIKAVMHREDFDFLDYLLTAHKVPPSAYCSVISFSVVFSFFH
jgi:hypothetical protein